MGDVTDDSDDSDDDTDTDSDSDEDTTDSDDNSFAAAFAAQKAAENSLMDRFEDDDDVATNEKLTISLSQTTMANLWGIAAMVILVNITLCVWCYLKTQNGKKRVRFMEDQYNSEIPLDNV